MAGRRGNSMWVTVTLPGSHGRARRRREVVINTKFGLLLLFSSFIGHLEFSYKILWDLLSDERPVVGIHCARFSPVQVQQWAQAVSCSKHRRCYVQSCLNTVWIVYNSFRTRLTPYEQVATCLPGKTLTERHQTMHVTLLRDRRRWLVRHHPPTHQIHFTP